MLTTSASGGRYVLAVPSPLTSLSPSPTAARGQAGRRQQGCSRRLVIVISTHQRSLCFRWMLNTLRRCLSGESPWLQRRT